MISWKLEDAYIVPSSSALFLVNLETATLFEQRETSVSVLALIGLLETSTPNNVNN
jgi:hypothetical protein